MRKKRFISIALAAVMAASVVGCGSGSDTAANVEKPRQRAEKPRLLRVRLQ